ncbi:MAG: Rnf-Nqr domain containing protein [Acholeplasmataceae bacterium]
MIEFTSLATMIVATLFINNVLLFSFLGLESLVSTEEKPKNALKLSLSLIFVLPLVSMVGFWIYHTLLFSTNELGEVIKDFTYFQTFVFVVTSTVVIVLFNVLIKRLFPKLYALIGTFTTQLVSNTIVLGVLLINISSVDTIQNSFYLSLFAAIGYGFVLTLLTFIEKHLHQAPVPKGFKGLPIQLIILSIIALILLGLSV